MPHTSRRPRASSGRRSPARGPRTPRPPQAEPHAEIDRALDAAAAASPSDAATFRRARAWTHGWSGRSRRVTSTSRSRSRPGRCPTHWPAATCWAAPRPGSGKTLAFGLPLLTRLAAAPGPRREKTPRGLVLVPTRELAQQVADVLVPLGRAVGVSIATVYGGVSISAQIARVRHADIVVATAGRLIDLLERHACTLSGIQVSVLDEADHMADLGFLPAVTQILDQTPADGQRMLFSATLDRNVGQLVTRYTTDAALHAVTSSTDSGPAEHRVLVLSARTRWRWRRRSPAAPGRTLFVRRTKHGADRLVKQLTRAGVEAAASTATATRTSGSGRWTRSPPGIPAFWSPPTSRPAASTWTMSTWSCSSIRRTTTRTICTVRAGRRGPALRHASSRGAVDSAANSASSGGCTTRRASPRPATRSRPGITWSGRSPRRARPFRPHRSGPPRGRGPHRGAEARRARPFPPQGQWPSQRRQRDRRPHGQQPRGQQQPRG